MTSKWVMQGRPAEQIGGGFFVFQRSKKTKRISMARLPFEHPSFEAASAEARRLADKWPGTTFIVAQQVDTAFTEWQPKALAVEPA